MSRTKSYFMRPLALLVWAVVAASVMMVVLASPARANTITVNSLADDADETDGKCTLREAITSANNDPISEPAAGECANGAGADVIDIGVTGTVNLSGVLPDLSNMEIEGPGADQFTVRRDSGGDYGIFSVAGSGDSGSVVSISGITIANGNVPSGSGGGILNYGGDLTVTDSAVIGNSGISGGGIWSRGTLTITGSTISGNSALQGGGGVFSQTDFDPFVFDPCVSEPEKVSTITNTTISGNTVTNYGINIGAGGGVLNLAGPLVIEHSTITANTAPDGHGSGVWSRPNLQICTEVLSTIISGNTNTDVDFRGEFDVDDTNTFESKGYNLIGDGNATGAFNQTGDQTPVTDPKLDALADNGGPTQTHALLAGSPALDAGPPTDGDPACPPPSTDQRGLSRPQGSACDIGAYELDQPPIVTINQASGQDDPTDKSPIHFTAVFNEPVSGFNGGDVTLSGTAGASTAVVSEIAPNNGTTYDVAVSGMTTGGTVIASVPANVAQDATANTNTASTSTDNTVFIADAPPVANSDKATTNEDNSVTIDVLANDSDPDGDALTVGGVTQPANGSAVLNADSTVTYTPKADFNGTDSFTYTISDGKGETATATATVTVTPANDAPVANNDAATVGEGGTVTGNVLTNDTDVDGDALHAVLDSGPANVSSFNLNPDGSFSYTHDGSETTTDSFTYKATDGSDVATGATVTITVTPENDAPTVVVAAGGACGTNYRSGTINLTLEDPDGPEGSLLLSATSSNATPVPTSNVTFGGAGAARTLTATAISGRTGTSVLTVTVDDGEDEGTVSVRVIVDGNGSRTTNGTAGADMIFGQNGDDVLNGSGSNDLLCGGQGNDTLNGAAGDDTMGGGQGADRFRGGDGTDRATDFTPSQGDTKDTTTE